MGKWEVDIIGSSRGGACVEQGAALSSWSVVVSGETRGR